MDDTEIAHKMAPFFLLINYFHRFQKYFHNKSLILKTPGSTCHHTNINAERAKDLHLTWMTRFG